MKEEYDISKTKRNFAIVGILILISLIIWGVIIATGPGDNLTLSHTRIVTNESGNRFVNGLLTNNRDRSYTGIEISFSLLDKDGKERESVKATTDILPGNKTWEFSVPFQTAEVTDLKILSISTVEEEISIN